MMGTVFQSNRRAISSSNRSFLFCTVLLAACVCALPLSKQGSEEAFQPRAWGGFDQRPMSEECYRQERTATLLALFLGALGVDQFYAHHWVLAAFKLLCCLLSSTLHLNPYANGLDDGKRSRCTILASTWWLVDLILWIVGGVYGTPGCPGGYHGL